MLQIKTQNKKLKKQVSKLAQILKLTSAKLIIITECSKDQSEGYMAELEKDIYILNINPKALDKKQTLAHEMIHIHQYDRGDLKNNQTILGFQKVWKGIPINPSLPYRFLPHEVEAFAKQDSLSNKI